MTSVLNVDTIAAKDGTSPVELTKQSASKAWFSADTWATADNSLNVSSISDDATGKSTVSWSNAFADDDYTVAGSSTDADGIVLFQGSKAAGTCPVYHFGGLAGSSAYNDKEMTADFHGDLA